MKKRKWGVWLAVSLLLCLIGAWGASLIQSDFGRVEVTEISIRTNAGVYTGYLFKPDSATGETPAPAIVTSHGYLNNREMQDINYVELARRGYVVFAQNAYSHGDSSVPLEGEGTEIEKKSGGMVDAVEYLAGLDFVDASRIGVTGHSMGGGFTDATAAYYSGLEREALASGATAEEAKAQNKVAAALIIGNYPLTLAGNEDTSGASGYLCDLGVVAGKYDEFYGSMSGGFGYELLTSDITKNLVAVQTGITLQGAAEEGHIYCNEKNGYVLALYNPGEFHAMNHFSAKTASYAVDFFGETLGAPNPIASSSQVWWLKEAFNLTGLIGFFAFIVPFAAILLEQPFFAELKGSGSICTAPLASGKEKRRYLITNILSGVLCAVFLLPLLLIGYVTMINRFWPQDTTGGIALWSLGSGLIALLMLRIGTGRLKGRGQELGIVLPKGKRIKTILLAVSVTAGTFMLVFLADYLFQTDFRIWSFDIRVFSASKIWVAVKYLPFFLVFYVINSLCVNRSCFAGWSERRQALTAAAFNIIAPVLFLLVTYVPVIFTKATIFGNMGGLMAAAGALIPILVIPFVPILGLAGWFAVKLQKLTGNIWLGGLVNAMVITMITVANTSFSYPY